MIEESTARYHRKLESLEQEGWHSNRVKSCNTGIQHNHCCVPCHTFFYYYLPANWCPICVHPAGIASQQFHAYLVKNFLWLSSLPEFPVRRWASPCCVFFWLQVYRRTARELKRLGSLSISPIYQQFTETLNGLATIRAYQQQDYFMEMCAGETSLPVNFDCLRSGGN